MDQNKKSLIKLFSGLLAADVTGGGGSGVGTSLGTIGGGGLGPFGNIGSTITSGGAALAAVTGAISKIIGFLTIAAGVWFLFQITVAGIAWMTSGGDKTKLTEARDRIMNAMIGLIIVVAGWAILALAGQFLGYDIIISNPAQLIEQFRL